MAINDVSGFGIVINITASNTFPLGLQLTQFPQDTDPLDFPSVDIADMTVGVNADAIVWTKANPYPMTIALIPGSIDDQNMQILWNANRARPGGVSASDVIQAAAIYPDGTLILRTNGRLIAGPSGKSVSGSGQLKTNVYGFRFES